MSDQPKDLRDIFIDTKNHSLHYFLAPKDNDLIKDISYLKREQGFIFLLDIFGTNKSGEVQLNYVLLNLERHERIIYKTRNTSVLPSIQDLWPAANIFEQRLTTEFGVEFKDTQRDNLFYSRNTERIYPLLDIDKSLDSIGVELESPMEFEDISGVQEDKNAEKSWIELDINCQIFGNQSFHLEVDGHYIERTKVDGSFYYRCIDRTFESTPFWHLSNFSQEASPSLGISHSVLSCMAIEKACQLKLSERPQVLRMVFLEIERIFDHVIYLAQLCRSMKMAAPWKGFFSAREKIIRLFELLHLNPYSPRVVFEGKDTEGISKHNIFVIQEGLKEVEKIVHKWHQALARNPFFMERLKTGKILAEDAINYSVTGPNLRACGVNYDLRKSSPYYFYDEVLFEIPLGIDGKSYDRYLVRVEEIFQSLNIIYQLLDNIPAITNERNELPHFLPLFEGHQALECSGGELGLYAHIWKEGECFNRFRFLTPLSAINEASSKMMKGMDVDDAIVSLSSLNLSNPMVLR